MTVKLIVQAKKGFSLVYNMKPIQILSGLLEVRGNIKVVDPMRVNNPDLDEEMEDKADE